MEILTRYTNSKIRNSKGSKEGNTTDDAVQNQAPLEEIDARVEPDLHGSPSSNPSSRKVCDTNPVAHDPSVQRSPQYQSGPSARGSSIPKRTKIAESRGSMATAGSHKINSEDVVTTDEEEYDNPAPAAKPIREMLGADPHTGQRRTKKPRLALQDNEDGAAEDLISNQEPAVPQEQTSLSTRSSGSKKKSAMPQHTPKPRKSTIAPRSSIDPSPSTRSTRSTPRETTSSPEIRVLFASSTTTDESKPFMKFLATHGVHKATSVQDCTILCVGKGKELKKTSKLIMAVLAGKKVITENWVSESVKAKRILDFEDYLATDPVREAEWGTTLSDAVTRGEGDLKPFDHWSFCFTPAVKSELAKGFADLKALCIAAGAKSIQNTIPKKGPQEPFTTVLIATNDDKDLDILRGKGWKVYTKEIITLSILRGSLDLESDEFLIETEATKQTGKSKKRKR